MKITTVRKTGWFAMVLIGHATIVHGQIAVSANDGKQRSADDPTEALTADDISVLNLASPPRILATLKMPASMIGPPAAVALARDSSYAIVTAAQKLGPDDTPVPADIVTVVDLKNPSKPAVLQSLHAGAGASGVAINPAGTMALVANAVADSISVFSVSGRHLDPVDTLTLPPKSRPVDVAFSGDGRAAYAVVQGTNSILHLVIDGRKVKAADSIPVGVLPYSMALNTKTRLAYVTNLGGRETSDVPGPKMGTIAVVDLRAGHMVSQVDVGITPEHLALSPSGRFVETTIINGSNTAAKAPNHHDHGSMGILRVHGMDLEPVAQVETGAWCQGATWSDDDKRVFLQCGARKQIEVYRFDGKTLSADAGATLQLDARPGAIATARSR
jgi:hypothetical protein